MTELTKTELNTVGRISLEVSDEFAGMFGPETIERFGG